MRAGRATAFSTLAGLALAGCAESTPEPAVRFGSDSGGDETGSDSGGDETGSDSGGDTGEPVGTLGLVQVLCEGWIGEAMLIVGPDGTRVLLDVGNDSHGDFVSDAVSAYTGAESVDAVVLTHFHEERIGKMNPASRHPAPDPPRRQPLRPSRRGTPSR